MNKYKVKPGFTIQENGSTYTEGQTLYLPDYRAEQLGIDKLEKVAETVTVSSNADLQKQIDEAKAEIETGLIREAELEKVNADLQKQIDEAKAEIEKLKKKK